jgi:hypothetical protein
MSAITQIRDLEILCARGNPAVAAWMRSDPLDECAERGPM